MPTRLERVVVDAADPGQDVPWVVLADPEGNQPCLLTPRGD